MKAVVLAAGEGTQLYSPTEDESRGMVEVNGKPIITHYFKKSAELSANKLVVVVGYLKEKYYSTLRRYVRGYLDHVHTM